jgi:putative ABC transport system permease protein
MLQDYKLGIRMLIKYPGLTLGGGLALAIAIAIGAGWYDLTGKVFWPTIPLPEGDRIVAITTHNILTNEPELRVARDFLEWRRELRTLEDLGAFRPAPRNLIVNNGAPERVQMAELTAAAFRTARVLPLLGRALLDSDEVPGAPSVVVLGYDVWQRALGGRRDVIGSEVRLGKRPATVVGVMPAGFGYPFNYGAWTPLQLRTSYAALEGGAISVIGRLAPGVTWAQADAEVRVLGERSAAALPATHEHLRPRVKRPGEPGEPDDDLDLSAISQLAIANLPVLLVLIIACTSVGTLVYARTATREGEIALRSALGASRARIVGQLFVEALVLASLAAGVGLIAADRTLRWGIESAYTDEGGVPFWITPGLSLTTVLYAGALAIITAALLSLLPALRATRARVQSHLANMGAGGATLRFGRFWTGAMVAQVALTAMGIPVAMEGVSQVARINSIRAQFPGQEYVAARIDLDPPFADEATAAAAEERRARTFAELERRVAQEPGVVAVTFADRAPGAALRGYRIADVETSPGAGPTFDYGFFRSSVGQGFFEAFERPIVAGRAFHGGDWSPAARTVLVNEAFVRGFQRRGGRGSPIGARLRYSDRSATSANAPSAAAQASADKWFEIVGVVRDLGLDLADEGDELPFVFHGASVGSVSPLVMSVRVRGNPATLVGRLPVLAADVDPGLSVQDAKRLDEWQDTHVITFTAALAAVNALVLFLSAMGLFSLMSVSVSRRTREIGLRAALGANPRHLLAEILSRAMVLVGSGIAVGGALLLWGAALEGPTGRAAEDIAQFAAWLGITAVVMLAACLLACIEPARRVLRINPADALREA